MFGSPEREHPWLTDREIIFKDFQNMIIIPQRHGQTDRQTDDLP